MNEETTGHDAAVIYLRVAANQRGSVVARAEPEGRASRRIDELLGMLSHELRSSLAPIRSSAHVLGHADPTSVKAARARDVIARQSERLSRTLEDLLDVTRIARRKMPLRRRRIDLRTVVAHEAESIRPSVEERDIALSIVLPAVEVWADADPVRLGQIVGHLLSNAAKFSRPGGRIVVTLRAVNGAGEITVRDTGVGIDPDLLPHVFDAFVRGKRTLPHPNGTLGVGLALVKGFAELHGGSVAARSEGPGRGAEFVVTMPLTPG